MPRLRILAGPTPDQLVSIQANSGKPTRIASDAFEGEVAVYIKGFADTDGRVGDSEYFEKRSGVTWSIQVQGKFPSLQPGQTRSSGATAAERWTVQGGF